MNWALPGGASATLRRALDGSIKYLGVQIPHNSSATSGLTVAAPVPGALFTVSSWAFFNSENSPQTVVVTGFDASGKALVPVSVSVGRNALLVGAPNDPAYTSTGISSLRFTLSATQSNRVVLLEALQINRCV
jgi:hypothetical protein